MEKYYFTFGSWEKFPYKNTYLIVVASSYDDAIKGFREKYPNKNPYCMNCSDCYSEKQWERVGQYYVDRSPAEVIWTDSCFGKKPEGYDDLFLFVPKMKQIVHIAKGTQRHQDQGYVDSIYYEQYELSNDMPEIGKGQIVLKERLRDKYRCMADCIQDVLNMAYGSYMVDCMILA